MDSAVLLLLTLFIGVSRNRSAVFKLMKAATHCLQITISFLITLFKKLTYLDTIWCEL